MFTSMHIGIVLCICVWHCLRKLCYKKTTTTGLSSLDLYDLYEEVTHLEYENCSDEYDELLSLLDDV